MSWKLGGLKIIVTSDTAKDDVKQSEHVILDGNESVLHYFGYGSDKRTIKAWLLDNPDDIVQIRKWHRVGSSVFLTDYKNVDNPYRIMELSWEKVNDISRITNLPIVFTALLVAVSSGSY